MHAHLKQADDDYKRVKYNTVVSAAMKMLNALEGVGEAGSRDALELAREGLSILLRILQPVVPHITHVLWEQLGYAAAMGDIVDAPWPQVDAAALAKERIELVLQINGKLRGKIEVAADADKAAIEAVAIDAAQAMHNGGAAPARAEARPRVIIVPNRLVNVVMPKNAA